MKRARVLPLVLVCVLLSAAVSWGDQDFGAQLSGGQEVPRVRTQATGSLDMTLSGHRIEYVLKVDGIVSPTAATIQRGRRGENGPPLAGLFGIGPVTGRFSGVLAQGTLNEESLIGELQGKKLSDLIRLMKDGNAYVNILTTTYPSGEIRGQILPQ